jgi:hypothetical protein
MKVLQKTLLSKVAGGETEEVLYANAGGGDWGGGEFSWEGGGSDYSWDSGGDYGWDDSGGGDFGGSSAAIASPAFDNNGVGMTSCVPMPPPPAPLSTGLFGYSMTETLTLAGTLGGGVGASMVIESVGGWSTIGALGAAGVGLGTATLAGIGASALVGVDLGSAIYKNSETVQDLSQKAWGHVFQAVEDVTQGAAELLDFDRKPHFIYHP